MPAGADGTRAQAARAASTPERGGAAAARVEREQFVLTVTPEPGARGGATVVVRTMPDVTVGRLAELVPVEVDLARRGVRALEIDLRFRDQVIARLP
jgi:cell division protein FtsQ